MYHLRERMHSRHNRNYLMKTTDMIQSLQVLRWSHSLPLCHPTVHQQLTTESYPELTSIHSTLSHYMLLRSTLMLSCHSHLGHPCCFFQSNPCYSSAYCSPASECGGPGSNPGQSRWDFSWANWYCANLSPSTAVSPIGITPSMFYIHSLIYHRRYINLAIDSVIK